MTTSTCIRTSKPDATDQEIPPSGQDLRDSAFPLRLWLSLGTSFAIATVVGAHGAAVRPAGTVIAVSQPGQTLGFNPHGSLDGAIRELAAEVLSTGQGRLQCLQVDAEAASYIGLSGHVSLQVHVTRVQAPDTAFGNVLRQLDSADARVVIIGAHRASGYAVVGPASTAGSLGWPELPPPVIEDARSMLGTRQTAWRTYGPRGERDGTGTLVWMQSYPRILSSRTPIRHTRELQLIVRRLFVAFR